MGTKMMPVPRLEVSISLLLCKLGQVVLEFDKKTLIQKHFCPTQEREKEVNGVLAGLTSISIEGNNNIRQTSHFHKLFQL